MNEYFEREESGLLFRFPVSAVWHVEKSQLYSSVQQNNKIAEFVFCDESMKFWVIEAKKGAPKVENSQSLLSELREKFINTGSLFAAVRLGFHPDFVDELPKLLRDCACKSSDIRFALVVAHPDCPQALLPPLHEALVDVLLPTLKIWGMKSTQIVVYNHESARQRNWLAPSIN
jgi:hypothetical protein